MDTSKQNQSELSYECTVGKGILNLFNGRLLASHEDITIGVNTFQIIISHIYNSFETQNVPCSQYGKGWKLNVEQYLHPDGDGYVYIDQKGSRHTFEKLRENEYYDKSGLNLLLKVSAQPEITDSVGNKIIFSSNRILKMVSGENSSISKKYNYDGSGKLTTIYDERRPGNRIEFNYDLKTGLLHKINSTKDYLEIESLFYEYDENQNLVMVKRESEGISQPFVFYRYSGNKLNTIFSMNDYSALEFSYYQDKVIKVKSGVLNYEKLILEEEASHYCGNECIAGDPHSIGEKGIIYRVLMRENMTSLNVNLKSENSILYEGYRSIMTNHKGVKIVYYFNSKGYTTSILEANNGDLMDLRHLEKMSGVQMIGNGGDPEKINTCLGNVLTTDMILTKDNLFSECFSQIQNYRNNKCPDYIHYMCTFWLKLEQPITNPKIEFKIFSENAVESKIISFDNSAIYSWQLISFPLKIEGKAINSIQMKFLDNKAQNYVTIADMCLKYSTSNTFYLTDIEIKDRLEDIIRVRYTDSVTSVVQNKEINEDFYLSDFDLRSTYLSYLKENGDGNSTNAFILSACNGTLKKYVNSVSFSANINTYQIGFYTDEYGTNTRTQYYSEIESPDGRLVTKGITHLLKNKRIGQKDYDCLYQITEASKRGNQNVRSKKELFVDLKGKTLLERDEYGLEVVYEYDVLGNLAKKKLQHNQTDEKIEMNYEINQWDSKEKDSFSSNQTFYKNPNGLIEKTSYNGNNEANDQALITNYRYNLLNNQCISIENNNHGKNLMRYDEKNRLMEASAMNWDDPNRYSYSFQYSTFNDPQRFYANYPNGNQIAQDLLVEKCINYENNTIQTKEYRNRDDADWNTVYLDKYDQTFKIEEPGKITIFIRQENNRESLMSSEVIEISDPFDNQKYHYTYDDANNLTRYEVKKANGTNVVSHYKSEENIDTCHLSSGSKQLFHTKSFEFTNDIFLEPRVVSTFQNFNPNPAQMLMDNVESTYEYDVLGRGKKIKHQVNDGLATTDITHEYNYKRNTGKIERIQTKIDNDIVQDTTYQFNYVYDERGNIKQSGMIKSRGNSLKTLNKVYTYDRGNRLIQEQGDEGYATKVYAYNNDGSLQSEMIGNNLKTYQYVKGQLVGVNSSNESAAFEYDNLGNCLKYRKNTEEALNLSWERGRLLKGIEKAGFSAQYHYNHQGIRYQKILSNGKSSTYYLDGEKILREDLEDGTFLTYIYDIHELIGFKRSNRGYNYLYVKDGMGNIVGVLDNDKEVAHYEYDAWGNHNITYQEDGVGELNPFRWKSQYYDRESGFYYIEGRYYSPYTKQYLSALSPETLVKDIQVIYGINRYLLTIENPVDLVYNGYSIETNYLLVWDPPKLSGWDRFWRSGWGKAAMVGLMVAAAVGCIIFQCIPAFLSAVGGTLALLGVGGAISGFISLNQGNGFWESFSAYVNENFVESMAISMIFLLAVIGMSALKTALLTSKKSALSNAKNISKCFIKGTLVKTEEGDKAIEEIKVGDKVWAYDEETGKKELKEVVQLFRNTTKQWTLVEIDGENGKETITCTAEHPFYILNVDNDTPIVNFEGRNSSNYQGQWVAAKDLIAGMKVLLSNGKNGIITKVETEDLDEPMATYNFEVADYHTYYVGQEGILVHNACGGDDMAEIIGKAHGSTEHQAEINRLANEMAKSGDYSKIYLNRSLSTTGVEPGNYLRPDIIGVKNGGGFRIVEVASRSQASGNALRALEANVSYYESLVGAKNVGFIRWGY